MHESETLVGIVLVDHGSKHAAANDMLVEVARQIRETMGATIVEPAHMEIAEPTIAQAFAQCVAQGAQHIVIQPYFLAPGRHSTVDIPRMSADAAAHHPGVPYSVAECLGIDDRLIDLVVDRIVEALPEDVE